MYAFVPQEEILEGRRDKWRRTNIYCSLCIRYYTTYFASVTSFSNECLLKCLLVTHFTMRKPRLKEVRGCAQGYCIKHVLLFSCFDSGALLTLQGRVRNGCLSHANRPIERGPDSAHRMQHHPFNSRTEVLNRTDFAPTLNRNIRSCHNTRCECSWCLVGRGQGCC